MCRLAVERSDLFDVSDLELRRSGPSYTVDTARALTRNGWDRVAWLIGGDTLPLLPDWHEPDALLREVEFVVVARPGWSIDWQSLPAAYHPLRARVVTAPLIEISATDIRRRVATGRSIDYLTPPSVVDYIRDRGVYAAGTIDAPGRRRTRANEGLGREPAGER